MLQEFGIGITTGNARYSRRLREPLKTNECERHRLGEAVVLKLVVLALHQKDVHEVDMIVW